MGQVPMSSTAPWTSDSDRLEGQILRSFRTATSEHGAPKGGPSEHRAWGPAVYSVPWSQHHTLLSRGAGGEHMPCWAPPQGHPQMRGHRPRALPRVVNAPEAPQEHMWGPVDSSSLRETCS